MAMTVQDFKIQRASGVCAATGQPLRPGDPRVTVLLAPAADGDLPTGDAALARLDFSVAAWEAGHRPGPGAAVMAFWRGVVPEREGGNEPAVNAAGLMDLFEQLAKATEPDPVALRYVVTLMLCRRRTLVLEKSEHGHGDHPARLWVRRREDRPPPELGGDGPPLLPVIEPTMSAEAVEALAERFAAVVHLEP